jgi:hypothetical protein
MEASLGGKGWNCLKTMCWVTLRDGCGMAAPNLIREGLGGRAPSNSSRQRDLRKLRMWPASARQILASSHPHYMAKILNRLYHGVRPRGDWLFNPFVPENQRRAVCARQQDHTGIQTIGAKMQNMDLPGWGGTLGISAT